MARKNRISIKASTKIVSVQLELEEPLFEDMIFNILLLLQPAKLCSMHTFHVVDISVLKKYFC